MSGAILSKDQKRAVLVGQEGFVGKFVLDLLIEHDSYSEIIVYSTSHRSDRSKGVEYRTAKMAAMPEQDLSCDDLFLCYDASFFNLGGEHYMSKDNYKYVPLIARKAFKDGVNQLMLLSSRYADPDSRRFTRRIRGLIEETIRKIDFWSKHIFRPGVIVGEDSGQTWGADISDKIGGQIDNYTGGWLKRNKPVQAELVARAMVDVAQYLREGEFVYRSDWLQDYDRDSSTQITKT